MRSLSTTTGVTRGKSNSRSHAHMPRHGTEKRSHLLGLAATSSAPAHHLEVRKVPLLGCPAQSRASRWQITGTQVIAGTIVAPNPSALCSAAGPIATHPALDLFRF